jgi:hypothetical protein
MTELEGIAEAVRRQIASQAEADADKGTPQTEQVRRADAGSNPAEYEQTPAIPRKRGRKQRYDSKKDKKIAEEWQRAHETGVEKKAFVKDSKPKLTTAELDRLLNRVRQRKNRAD